MIKNLYGEFEPFTEEYSIYLVSRKKGQPKGYSTRDMSNDYAEIIRHNFGGHVDIIIGTSFGGMITQHFAVDHPELFDHIVIAIAAHRMSDIGQQTVDVYFPKESIEEMASLIAGSSLKLYGGKGHLGALEDEAFAKDIFEFTGRKK